MINFNTNKSIFFILGLLIFTTLACGSLPTVQQAKDIAATTQSLAGTVAAEATRLAPTLQAGGGTAIAQVSTAAAQVATALPTWQAEAGTAIAQVATAAPTYQAQLEALATQASIAAGQGADIIATVQASDLNLDGLQSIFEAVDVDSDGNFTMVITEAQLNEAVALRQTQAADQGEVPAVQDLHFTLQDGIVTLQGNILEPIESSLLVAFIPSIVDGGIHFTLVSAQIGGITVPTALVDGAESALNSTIGDAITNLPAGFTITAVTVSQGTLVLTGSRQ
ncbi:MAG: hypothetical protein KAG66_16495 [Methylococcales bacterium]|nr:hypothetical protein [Methylococcales bacterium]